MTKKILFVETQSEFGGAQRFIYTFVNGLRRYTQICPDPDRDTQINADKGDFLYSDITYRIRGACFRIWKEFRGAYKEKIIERALTKELQNQGLLVDAQKQISVLYDSEKIGKYVPDMVINDKVLVELKSKTFLTKEDEKQFWLYLKGSEYRLGLLVNFGKKLEIKRRIYDLARNGFQRKSATDFEIIVAAGPEGDNEKGLLSALEKDGINTVHLRYLRRSVNFFLDLFGFFEIYRLIKNQKPDILFLCSTKAGVLGSFANYFYLKLQRKSAYSEGQNRRVSARPKVIYRIGGWTFNDPWPKWKKKIYILIEKLTARFKDIIINNAKSDTEQAKKLGIKPKKEILTIYNGVDIKTLNSEFLNRNEARGRLNLGDLDFIIGTIATLYPTKGLKYLIEAAHLLKDKNIKFILIGEGQEKEEIENLIKNYNLSEKFVLIKPTYKDYIYLKAFDAFVLPSLKEGFPWTILEAMVAEVPIIATRVGAIPEIIEDGKTGLLAEPGNPEQLAEIIEELIKSPELREKLVKEGIKMVKERFGSDKMVRQIEELL